MAGGDTGSNSTKSEPNVVPLCDILLVLLIIFMVVTPLIQKGAVVQLPEAVNYRVEPEPGKMTEVTLKKNGEIYLNNTLIEAKDLVSKIESIFEDEKNSESKVLLKADIEIEYGKVVDLMDLIKRANVEVVGLVTEQSTSSE
jgi:biopolymer transport protein TolR